MTQLVDRSNSLIDAGRLILAGHLWDARHLLDGLLQDEPADAEILHLRALADIAGHDFHAGIARLRCAVSNCPDPDWLRDLGVACLAGGLPADAIDPLQLALSSRAGDPELCSLLAHAMVAAGNAGKAVAILESLPDCRTDVQAARSLGEACMAAGFNQRALQILLEACSLDPASLQGFDLCARAAFALSRFDLAVEQRRRALALSPHDCGLQSALANALWLAGRMEECLELSRSVRAAFPDDESAHANWLAAVDHTTFNAGESRRAWEDWAAVTARSTPRLRPRQVIWNPDRRLRVGYLIDEINKRPNSYAIPPLFENHDAHSSEMFCYFGSPENSEEWETLRQLTPNVRDSRTLSTLEIARQVSDDGIDILVNLSWEFRRRHIAVFGHRPAPIQIELPHYPATTGHPDTDFILTDRWICPPGQESMYSEKVVRLSCSYLPWTPPDAPAITDAPVMTNGFFTFGMFQRPAKLNAHLWDAVCEILRFLPSSRLLIHHSSADIEIPGSDTCDRLRAQFASRGVVPDRVTFTGIRDHLTHLSTIAQCDIALDSFPYNGTSTTGDSLWMGVPVVTLAGQTHAGRVGLSMLSRVGLLELAASTVPQYVATALGLAQSPQRIAELRSGLRQRMQTSTLVNARSVMSGIEREYRLIWQDRCKAELQIDERKP